jgi:hypothetical protein
LVSSAAVRHGRTGSVLGDRAWHGATGRRLTNGRLDGVVERGQRHTDDDDRSEGGGEQQDGVHVDSSSVGAWRLPQVLRYLIN